MASSITSMDNNNNSSSSKFYYLTAVVAVAVVPLLLASLSKKKKKRGLQRSWSFTSQGMCLGIFPPATKAPATIINAALYFSGGEEGMPSAAELVNLVIQPLLQYERFATVPPYYENTTTTTTTNSSKDEAPKFNPQDLVRTIPVTVPDKDKDKDGEQALHQAMYQLLEDSLERPNLPWFEVVRLVNTSTKSKAARSICLLRVHHCLGDGLSLVAAFDKIITTLDGKPSESKVTNAMMDKKPATPPMSSILSALGHVLGLASTRFDDPTVFFKRAPKNLEYSGNRIVTLFPTVPLAYMKLLKNTYNDHPDHHKVTLNDIMMCVISQSIYEYCVAQKDPLIAEKAQALQCRALLPASLPRSKHSLQDPATAMTNQFCMVSADMSVGYRDIMDRLGAIRTTTSFLKTTPRAFIQLWLQNNIVDKLPVFVGRNTALDIFSRHSLVLTNVPGPPEPCRIGSKVVQGLQLFFPNVIPQVDLLTYAGQVYGNIVYDPDCLVEGDSLAGLYAKALVTLGREIQLDEKEIPKELVEAAKSV